MDRNPRPSFSSSDRAPVDLSPAAVARYRALAEQKRNEALAGAIRRFFGARRSSSTRVPAGVAPAE